MASSFQLRVTLCSIALLFFIVASSSSSVETPYGPVACLPFLPDYGQCVFSYQQVKYNLTSANNLQGDYWATLDDLNIYYMQPCMQTITACVAPFAYFKNEAQACHVDEYFTQTIIGSNGKQSGPMTPPIRYNGTPAVFSTYYTWFIPTAQYTSWITFFCVPGVNGQLQGFSISEGVPQGNQNVTNYYFDFGTQFVC